MAKSSSVLGKILFLVGISCFINTGMSMLRCKYASTSLRKLPPQTLLTSAMSCLDRRHVVQEGLQEGFIVPLDIKVEVLIGLMLCVVGTIAVMTCEMHSIDALIYYQYQ